MALDNFTGLPAAIGLTGAEIVPIVQSGTTKRTTTQGIANLAFTSTGAIQAALNTISTTQGTLLYRNASDWVALAPSTAGYVLTTQGPAANPTWDANLAADITIGSSIVTGGTNTRILYDNAGVVGEYTTTGTGTVVAMQTAPTFLTFASMPRLLMTQSAITADAPQISALTTLNNAAEAFTVWKLNVTDTASDAATKFLDFQVSSSSKFSVNKSGQLGLPQGEISVGGGSLQVNSGNQNDLRAILGSSVQGQTLALMSGVSADVFLQRDAANTLAQRNSTNPQNIRVYQTYTDGSNYERLNLGWTAGVGYISTENAGSGTLRDLYFNGATITIQTQGNTRWQINATGHMVAATDNTYDIGASGASRPRSIYAGTDIRLGNNGTLYWGTTGSSIYGGTNGTFQLGNQAGNDFGRLQFGGTTSSFPALKRSSATLQVVLADDSAGARFSVADGSDSTPGYSFVSDASTGMSYRTGSPAIIRQASLHTQFIADRVQTDKYLEITGFGTGVYITAGTGSPEGVVTAPTGSLYLNKSGGTDTTMYTKNSGSGNTGWIAVDNV